MTENAEKLRPRLVRHQGRRDLIADVSDLSAVSFEQAIGSFSAQIREETDPVLHETLICDFSTTTPASRVASEVALMDTFSSYFTYTVNCICGIPKTRPGDLWLCGRHRVLCGDATNVDDVARLLDGRKPFLMVTDPPYGISLDSEWRDRAGLNGHGAAEPSYMKHRTTGHTETTISGDTRADWSGAYELVPSLQVVYVWHAPVFAREVWNGLRFNLRERATVTFECGLLAGQGLPPEDHHVDVFRIKFYSETDALGQFRRSERGRAAEEQLVDRLAALRVIQDRAPHQLDRFLRRVIEFLFLRSAHDKFR